MEWTDIILSLLPSLIVSAVMLYWGRAQNRRDADMARHTEAKRKQELLAMKMQMATAKLAYANSMAIKRGTPNGEIEEGVDAYEDARRDYLDFLNEQAAEHLNG